MADISGARAAPARAPVTGPSMTDGPIHGGTRPAVWPRVVCAVTSGTAAYAVLFYALRKDEIALLLLCLPVLALVGPFGLASARLSTGRSAAEGLSPWAVSGSMVIYWLFSLLAWGNVLNAPLSGGRPLKSVGSYALAIGLAFLASRSATFVRLAAATVSALLWSVGAFVSYAGGRSGLFLVGLPVMIVAPWIVALVIRRFGKGPEESHISALGMTVGLLVSALSLSAAETLGPSGLLLIMVGAAFVGSHGLGGSPSTRATEPGAAIDASGNDGHRQVVQAALSTGAPEGRRIFALVYCGLAPLSALWLFHASLFVSTALVGRYLGPYLTLFGSLWVALLWLVLHGVGGVLHWLGAPIARSVALALTGLSAVALLVDIPWLFDAGLFALSAAFCFVWYGVVAWYCLRR